jgi:hypothetical protein
MVLGFAILMMLGLLTAYSAADDDSEDHHSRKNIHDHNGRHHDDEAIRPVNNAAYIDQCGGCHFAYQPELLPAESWRRIIDATEDHFGESVDLDEDARREIEMYLTSNAANTSAAELSQKIIRSLKGRTPLRITDIPYIRREHHELPPHVIKQASVGTLGNCVACHRNAENGDYDDDRVSVPR